MLNQDNTYIKFASFSRLVNWSVQYLSETQISFNHAYTLVRIGDFLRRNKTSIKIENDKTYKRVTIKVRNGGVIQRDTEIGKNIGTKRQFAVSKGQFILSKIDARNGAMGIIPADLNGAIVTPDFLPYDINTDIINPQYLVLISTTKEFSLFCQNSSSGTTNRQRIEEAKFLNIEIPLPSLEEQNTLVKSYNDRINKATKEEIKAKDLEAQVEHYLLNTLGVNITEIKNKAGLSFVEFKNIIRWDVYNLKNENTSEFYDIVPLKEIIINKPKYGAPFKSSRKITDTRYIRITDINENGSLNEDVVSAEKFDKQYLLKHNDFLFARSGNTVGKTFLYNQNLGKAIYAGYLIKFELDTTKIHPLYLLFYTKSLIYKNWIASNMRVSAQPNINSQQYLDSTIILPPIEIQNKIVAHAKKLNEQIKTLKAQAEINRTMALTEFAQHIF